MTFNITSKMDKNYVRRFSTVREYFICIPFMHEELYMASKCVTISDSLRGRKIVTCLEVHS